MANTTQRHGFGRRINAWLAEPRGEIFRQGKWRFWLPTLLGLTALNAAMTALIFGQDGMQKYIGAIVVMAAAVLCWLALGLLHYSDSEDRLLAVGVAALDSVTLLFVALHFSGLLWCQGRLWNLRAAETKYQAEVAEYNAQAARLSTDNNDLARTAERIAEIEKQTERLRNDTAYWSRRSKVKTSQSGIQFQWSPSKVEMSPPPTPPPEASAAFLARWDLWIRAAGLGELTLSLVTLIFVRTRTATLNPYVTRRDDGEWPDEIEEKQVLFVTPDYDSRTTVVNSGGFDRRRSLQILRDHLREIAPKGNWFRSDLIEGGCSIRQYEWTGAGEQVIASTNQSDKLLRAVERGDFRERLRDELARFGFRLKGL